MLLFGLYTELLNSTMLINQEIFALLDTEISKAELEKLDKLQKTKYTQDNKTTKRQKQETLNGDFDTIASSKQRNKNIKEAVQDGYKQSEIAEFLQLSRRTISKIIRKANK